MKTLNDFYTNEGVVIIANGQMILGIHPDNVENNLMALADGRMQINWGSVLDRWKEAQENTKIRNKELEALSPKITVNFDRYVYAVNNEVDIEKIAKALGEKLVKEQRTRGVSMS